MHIHTLKGNGDFYAETYKEKFHWAPPFNIETGEPLIPNTAETYNKVVINYITKKVNNDNRIVVVNAAILAPLSVCEFRDNYPQKFIDVGIAEEHAIAFSSGLASQGMKSIIIMISTFIQNDLHE